MPEEIIKYQVKSFDVQIDKKYYDERAKLLHESIIVRTVDEKNLEIAKELLNRITKLSNGVEKQRKDLCKPLNDANKNIKMMVDSFREKPESEKSRLKMAIADYVREVERKQQEEAMRIAEEQERLMQEQEKKRLEQKQEEINPFSDFIEPALEPEIDLPAFPEPETKSPDLSGVKKITVWKWRIEDITKIPREFFVLDERLINQHVRQNKENSSIPGVKIYSEINIQS